MGANAQTTVPTFTTGQVLTADQMNQSARTGVPVFADTTARDAGFGGSGEKTLAEGQLCYLENTNVVQYYDGSVWATVGPQTVNAGLDFISSTTVGSAVASVTVTGAFSATYDHYRIIADIESLTGNFVSLQLGATTTGYYSFGWYGAYNSAVLTGLQNNNGAAFTALGRPMFICDLLSPYLADETAIFASGVGLTTTGVTEHYQGYLNNTTSYTAFTVAPNSGTITGGTIKVYGYKN